jgi:hypothetical protein
MPNILLETTDCASRAAVQAFGIAGSNLDSPSKFVRASRSGQERLWDWRLPEGMRDAETLRFSEIEFWQQKQAFLALPSAMLAAYTGEFVIVRNGQILDHDRSLPALTSRFFRQVGDMAVYISRIGGESELRIDTPFFD